MHFLNAKWYPKNHVKHAACKTVSVPRNGHLGKQFHPHNPFPPRKFLFSKKPLPFDESLLIPPFLGYWNGIKEENCENILCGAKKITFSEPLPLKLCSD